MSDDLLDEDMQLLQFVTSHAHSETELDKVDLSPVEGPLVVVERRVYWMGRQDEVTQFGVDPLTDWTGLVMSHTDTERQRHQYMCMLIQTFTYNNDQDGAWAVLEGAMREAGYLS
ncbi:hypothetical protein PBI_SUZY_87 [Gordonia phage Suzy]|uniref:Uncharacterized protein n=1 Tax=Gordonia phage Suzy TaxID=2201430 RepID=A0A2Z4Q835_9CAUD|nr:hypothetical protein HOT44_gp87 [Gordonia phage Suzy]AWY06191.1 hypothetical protein PBI_SUZY_87 [Gordonia phage Suzy]